MKLKKIALLSDLETINLSKTRLEQILEAIRYYKKMVNRDYFHFYRILIFGFLILIWKILGGW